MTFKRGIWDTTYLYSKKENGNNGKDGRNGIAACKRSAASLRLSGKGK